MADNPRPPANPRIVAKHPGRNKYRGKTGHMTAAEIHARTMLREPEPLHLARHGLAAHKK